MRACSLGLVGFRVRDKVRLGLVLGIGLVLGLAHFTFCHTSKVSLKHDGTAKQTGHGRWPVCPVGDGTAKTDGTAVVEAKWDTNRNLTVVTHVVCLHV